MKVSLIGQGNAIELGFKPAWWCPSAHAQTIWAAIQRPIPEVNIRRERWETEDGDFLDIDQVDAAPGSPVVVFFHGLESSSSAKAIRGFMFAAHSRQWRGLAVNFRSCSGELNRNWRTYHAGETTDCDWVIRRAAKKYPNAPIFAVGLSLGANVLLKYLGEQKDKTLLKAAVAISAPFNLAVSALEFEKGLLNRRYMSRLLRSLKIKTLGKLKQFPGKILAKRLDAVHTIRAFDEVVTAPMSGFKNARDYWRACSCSGFLPAIQRPTLLINACDDPLVPARVLPRRAVAKNSHLRALFTATGGHMGFIGGRWPSQPTLWAEQQAFAFMEQYQ